MKTGKVIFYNEKQGFGFIEDVSDGARFYVKRSDIALPLKEGDRVKFEVKMFKKGPGAVNVQKILQP